MVSFSSQRQVKNSLLKKIEILEARLKVATTFLQQIADGDHHVEFNLQEVDEHGSEFKTMLLRTRNKLSEYAQRDHERAWAAQGMANFIQLIQGDRTRKDFYDAILSMVVKYTGMNQGGIFLLNDLDPQNPVLELTACYAYGKKKHIQKRIKIGEGLLGQTYLEKETSIYSNVPKDYVRITSGLGEATPQFLLLTPMIYDHQVVGVMELAAFKPLEKYKIDFIERIAENMASVVIHIQHTLRATQLYEESQQKAKLLKEQEEILRQNIEELNATQEEMKRHQLELSQQTYMLKFIVDNIPFPIFVKDDKGRYTLVNKSEAKLFNLHDGQLIGKDDSHFVSNAEEWRVIQESDEKVLSADTPLELPLQHFTTPDGHTYIFKTTKIPFVNHTTGKKNILGVSFDLTEKLSLEKELMREKNMNHAHVLINLVGRQRMLSQKIGFYAEMVVKGNMQHASEFKASVELFENSLQVIKEGGYPDGASSQVPLPPADEALHPYIQRIEHAWKDYGDAAKKILFYLTFEDLEIMKANPAEIEESLSYIEENAETILNLNDDLMQACMHLHQDSMVALHDE